MTSSSLIGFVYNAQHPTALQMTEAVMRSLNLGDECWMSPAANLDAMRSELLETRLIVMAGGDGTILRVVRTIAEYGIPLVGINMGRIGFMAELQVHEAIEELPAYLNGSARLEERMMLEVNVRHGDEQEPYLNLHALNDVVVGRGGSARLLDIVATIDGVILTSYRADAVIVSTATGSTGYALSAGGPIMYPETMAMLIQPVAAHTGLRSGLILPDYTQTRASGKRQARSPVKCGRFHRYPAPWRRPRFHSKKSLHHALPASSRSHRVLCRPHPPNARHGHSNLQPGR